MKGLNMTEETIIQRDSFKEAFADVLKLSHDELIRHPIDPFVQESFDMFEKMDFSMAQQCPNLFFSSSTYFSVHKCSSKVFFNDYFVMNRTMGSLDIHHEPVENADQQTGEVQQWLLAA